MAESIIEYRNVYKRFDVPVLEDVSLSIAEGETLGIVGPSGAGKSVLLKTTIGLIAPDRGEVFVAGRSVTRASARELDDIRGRVGYVFQHSALFDSMSVYDNVAMGLSRDLLKQLPAREVTRRVRQALVDVNLDADALFTKLPDELSGGMRKRVGVARAIVGKPQILLYDEPVTGLDPMNVAAVDRLIVSIAARDHVTSVIVTHDIEGILAICDRIALIESRRLRFVGTAEAFRSSSDEMFMAFAHREEATAAAVRSLVRH
jgi:phospholipid/cholesterol/gamma-HCH transport system ATP-binding protein